MDTANETAEPAAPPSAEALGQPTVGRRMPDFFVIGHPKCGTTALHGMLAKHPQIFVGDKEPRYFATELYERDIPRPGGSPQTPEQYMAWFARARPEQKIGDISPAYLWSKSAAPMIAEASPEAKLIGIFREPASYLASMHRQWLKVYAESEIDFEKALALEDSRREGRNIPADTFWPRSLLYSEHVRYVEQLRRYDAHFSPEQKLVLIYDDYRNDNEATLSKILDFIGVEPQPVVNVHEANPSVQLRSRRGNDIVRRLLIPSGPVSRTLKKTITTLTPLRVRRKTLRTVRKNLLFGDVTPPSEQFMTDLRRRLKPEVVALSEYLDRDLVALWGYDKL
ncbi:MAG TPA: sulfotransferase [Solirubrobacteraceae bacterium]|nr:sulfotransferase [Solirubrobacteraceae bacterium]